MTRQRVRHSSGIGTVAALALVGLIAFGALSGSGRAAAQDVGNATPGPTPIPATVSVNGHGAVMVPPDTASVVVGVDVTSPTLDAAQTEATAQATAIIDAVMAAGIPEDDIQTVNFSVNVIRDVDQNGNQGAVTGFQVTNQVAVTIRGIDQDLERVGTILDSVVAAGANNIYGISFTVDDPTAAAVQARRAAVLDSRAKADQLAEAAGLTVGRVVTITESPSAFPPPQVFEAAAADMAQARAAVPIQGGSSEVTVDVQVTFELQ